MHGYKRKQNFEYSSSSLLAVGSSAATSLDITGDSRSLALVSLDYEKAASVGVGFE